MLTNPQAFRRGQQPASLRQEYEEFILQRIEEFKDQLPRHKLLELADEAVRELEIESAEQLVLTEMMMLEHVDRLIIRRLRLPSYRRWREKFRKLRQAQREPTHWGLDPDTPLAALAGRLGPDDLAVVVGGGAAPAAFYLAALDAAVLLVDQDLGAVEMAESRAAAEAVATRFQALVVSASGGWFPELEAALVVIDPAAMAVLEPSTRMDLLERLKDVTASGGAHCVLPAEPRSDVIPLAPEALQAGYGGWRVERGRRSNPRARWFVAVKPGAA
jgi:hypothetical protein